MKARACRFCLRAKDWIEQDQNNPSGKTLLDVLMTNPNLARLYWALARMDGETRTELKQSVGLDKLVPHGRSPGFLWRLPADPVGASACFREAPARKHAWKVLVGASPGKPGDFVLRLVTRG